MHPGSVPYLWAAPADIESAQAIIIPGEEFIFGCSNNPAKMKYAGNFRKLNCFSSPVADPAPEKKCGSSHVNVFFLLHCQ